jgi:hypothetical protein
MTNGNGNATAKLTCADNTLNRNGSGEWNVLIVADLAGKSNRPGPRKPAGRF